MTHQQNSGAARDVAVISYIHEQSRRDALLYPAMEHRDGAGKIGLDRLLRKDFDIDVFYLHHPRRHQTATICCKLLP